MIEELVQLLVRVIDAQLLETIGIEVLEAKDIQHTEKPRYVLARIRAVVDVIDEPGEGPGVQGLGHGVPVLLGLLNLQRYLRDVASHVDLALQDDPRHVLQLQADQRCHGLEDRAVLRSELAALAVDVLEAQVAQPEDCREHAEYALAHLRWHLRIQGRRFLLNYTAF